jgi:hypothetical protein
MNMHNDEKTSFSGVLGRFVGEILGTSKLSESRMDMRFKGVRGEGECGPKRIKLVFRGGIDEGGGGNPGRDRG